MLDCNWQHPRSYSRDSDRRDRRRQANYCCGLAGEARWERWDLRSVRLWCRFEKPKTSTRGGRRRWAGGAVAPGAGVGDLENRFSGKLVLESEVPLLRIGSNQVRVDRIECRRVGVF